MRFNIRDWFWLVIVLAASLTAYHYYCQIQSLKIDLAREQAYSHYHKYVGKKWYHNYWELRTNLGDGYEQGR